MVVDEGMGGGGDCLILQLDLRGGREGLREEGRKWGGGTEGREGGGKEEGTKYVIVQYMHT